MTNPWLEEAHDRESRFGDLDVHPKLAHSLIDQEYLGSDEYTQPCHHAVNKHCSGTLYLKATIGCLKCDTCGALAHCNGDPIT